MINEPYDETYEQIMKIDKMSPKELNELMTKVFNQRVKHRQLKLDEFSLKKKHKEEIKYTQKWSAYNNAKMSEMPILLNILDELLDYVPFPEKKRKVGRKTASMRDKIFCMVLQNYNRKGSRKCVSELKIHKNIGLIERPVHFNTLLGYYRDPSLTPYLQHLISVSGLPLKHFEQNFAADGSGFSTATFERWVSLKTDKLKRKKFRKINIICGTKTNIICAVKVTEGYRNDIVPFKDLLLTTNKVFDIKELSADKAYSSKENYELISDLGIVPFIPFKSNATKRKKPPIWRKLYDFFINNHEEFLDHYHQRNNVEATFAMIKKVFGNNLRSRDGISQTNELLIKCLCHNLCVLVQEMFELPILIDFKKCAEFSFAH